MTVTKDGFIAACRLKEGANGPVVDITAKGQLVIQQQQQQQGQGHK